MFHFRIVKALKKGRQQRCASPVIGHTIALFNQVEVCANEDDGITLTFVSADQVWGLTPFTRCSVSASPVQPASSKMSLSAGRRSLFLVV